MLLQNFQIYSQDQTHWKSTRISPWITCNRNHQSCTKCAHYQDKSILLKCVSSFNVHLQQIAFYRTMKIQITSARSRLEISLFFCLLMRQYIQMILLQVSLECVAEAVVAFLATLYLLDFDYPKQHKYGLLMLQLIIFMDEWYSKQFWRSTVKDTKSIKWNAQSKDKYSLHWNWSLNKFIYTVVDSINV